MAVEHVSARFDRHADFLSDFSSMEPLLRLEKMNMQFISGLVTRRNM